MDTIIKSLEVELESLRTKEEELTSLLKEVASDLNTVKTTKNSILTALIALDPSNYEPDEYSEVLLGQSAGDGPRIRSTAVGHLSNKPEPTPVPAPVREIPVPYTGPQCPSCGGRASETYRTLGNGKTLRLLVCGECSNESIM